MTESKDALPKRWENRGRWILGALLLLGTIGTLLLGLFVNPPGSEGSAVTLELASDTRAFKAALAEGWREDEPKLCGVGAEFNPGGHGLGTLRCHLFIDSILLVPGYVGLLVYFTMTLSRIAPGRRDLLVHLLCAPAVAAGLFDIAENGMTVVAAEDLLNQFLTDSTVGDVRLASLCKWSLVAVSFAEISMLAWLAARSLRTRVANEAVWPLYAAVTVAALCAVIIGIGVTGSKFDLLAPGMLLAMVTFVLLSMWRFARFPKIADRLASPGVQNS